MVHIKNLLKSEWTGLQGWLALKFYKGTLNNLHLSHHTLMPPPSPASRRLAQVGTGESIYIFNDCIGTKGASGTLEDTGQPQECNSDGGYCKGHPQTRQPGAWGDRKESRAQGQAVGPQASCLTSLSCLSSFIKWRYFSCLLKKTKMRLTCSSYVNKLLTQQNPT